MAKRKNPELNIAKEFEKLRKFRAERREKAFFLVLEIEQAKDILEYERKVQELEELHEKGDIDVLYYLQLKRALTVLPKPRISRSGSAHVSDYVQLRNAGLSHKFISIYLNCSLSYLLHLSWTEYYKKHFNQALYNENKIVI